MSIPLRSPVTSMAATSALVFLLVLQQQLDVVVSFQQHARTTVTTPHCDPALTGYCVCTELATAAETKDKNNNSNNKPPASNVCPDWMPEYLGASVTNNDTGVTLTLCAFGLDVHYVNSSNSNDEGGNTLSLSLTGTTTLDDDDDDDTTNNNTNIIITITSEEVQDCPETAPPTMPPTSSPTTSVPTSSSAVAQRVPFPTVLPMQLFGWISVAAVVGSFIVL